MNITFDLLPKLENLPRDKKVRYAEVCRRALAASEEYLCAHVWNWRAVIERYLLEELAAKTRRSIPFENHASDPGTIPSILFAA